MIIYYLLDSKGSGVVDQLFLQYFLMCVLLTVTRCSSMSMGVKTPVSGHCVQDIVESLSVCAEVGCCTLVVYSGAVQSRCCFDILFLRLM